ncbi:hypothetical protein BCV72DRAFT_329203 [Rhizopus microsporus var. microsporus]|uniref:Ndc10 domain-containing protein n=1 Tax=Rhizopus microsporus var. microsporus TaxID=86635 RepID=A0A1X0R2H8_RHIZD|nr:hypothetical protein BCV72DRAFT_329203 [Rhizopus microsporus var. microsporus]
MKRGRKLRRNPDGTLIALSRESVLAYIKYIADMYSKQKALGLNPHGPARGPLVRIFLDTLEKEKKNDPLGFKDRLCFLISHAMLCRSQTALGMQLADLLSLVLEDQGIPECIALVATITFGKTNQHGKIECDLSVRHHDGEACSVGALVINLFFKIPLRERAFT